MSNVMKSKRFVVRKSLIGKNQVITFTNKKGDDITYNHDKVYEIMKSTLETKNQYSYTDETLIVETELRQSSSITKIINYEYNNNTMDNTWITKIINIYSQERITNYERKRIKRI